jgi:polysaccharide deacetylase family protein (PEP-CTERM system associated)
VTVPHAESDRAADGPGGAHLLSFDVEEYFQVEAAARGGVTPGDWGAYPRRLEPAVDRILAALAETGASATFFILGWVARHEPQVVRRIAQAGHPVASHGMAHRMLHHFDPAAFRHDLDEARRALEDLAGRAVLGYRAPTFSVTNETAWAVDVLADAGYRYDSSVFPIRHDRYGVPDAPTVPHRAGGPGGGSILEIPPLTLRFAGGNWPVGGGGYLRLFPRRLAARALAKAGRRGTPGMVYMHPWEIDPDQPVLPMSRAGRFRHRVGLRRAEGKLRWLLARFRFTSVEARLDDLEAGTQATYAYGKGADREP